MQRSMGWPLRCSTSCDFDYSLPMFGGVSLAATFLCHFPTTDQQKRGVKDGADNKSCSSQSAHYIVALHPACDGDGNRHTRNWAVASDPGGHFPLCLWRRPVSDCRHQRGEREWAREQIRLAAGIYTLVAI